MIELRLISHDSEEYRQELSLRDHVLRQPLGMDIRDDDLSRESSEFHLGAFSGDSLIGVVILSPAPSGWQAAMRQLAVAPEFQGQGVGASLVRALEQLARQRGITELTLQARKTALGFYQTLGYEKRREEFLHIGIPHFSVGKRLAHS